MAKNQDIIEGYKARDYKQLKEVLDAKLKPILEVLNKHELALHGEDTRGGITKDVNDVKSAFLTLKFLFATITTFFAGITALFGLLYWKK